MTYLDGLHRALRIAERWAGFALTAECRAVAKAIATDIRGAINKEEEEMEMSKSADHVTIKNLPTGGYELECLRCCEKYTPALPCPLDIFLATARAFGEKHGECREPSGPKSVAGGIAAYALSKSNRIEIPSLGIVVERKDQAAKEAE